MSTWLPYIPATFLGLFTFSFFYWRRLKEDYVHTMIFSSIFFMLASISVGLIISIPISHLFANISFIDASQLWFWFALVGWIVGLFISTKKLYFKFVETFEASGMGLLIWVWLITLTNALGSPGRYSLSLSMFTILYFLLYRFLESKYKSFSWYRSGKVGFSGIVTLAVYFLTRTILALFSIPVVSLAGSIEVVLSSVVAFLLFFAAYQLSER